jgi:hypothetical protein
MQNQTPKNESSTKAFSPLLPPLPPVSSRPSRPRLRISAFCFLLSAFGVTGCSVLSYTSPTGEHFSRSSLGSATSFSSLSVVTDPGGLRRVELRGYTNDSTQALGTVTEAAVRAAIQSAK